jgi:hypothetical protein
MMFKEQADKCRRQANEFAGRPEAPFLLRVASAFDELATDPDLAKHVHAPATEPRPVAPHVHA